MAKVIKMDGRLECLGGMHSRFDVSSGEPDASTAVTKLFQET